MHVAIARRLQGIDDRGGPVPVFFHHDDREVLHDVRSMGRSAGHGKGGWQCGEIVTRFCRILGRSCPGPRGFAPLPGRGHARSFDLWADGPATVGLHAPCGICERVEATGRVLQFLLLLARWLARRSRS